MHTLSVRMNTHVCAHKYKYTGVYVNINQILCGLINSHYNVLISYLYIYAQTCVYAWTHKYMPTCIDISIHELYSLYNSDNLYDVINSHTLHA